MPFGECGVVLYMLESDRVLFKNFSKLLGQNIREQRIKKGLSQEKLAFAIDSARNYIGCIERAEKSLSLKMLFKIATVLEVRIEDLLKGTMIS